MKDQIKISGISVYGYHGVLESETREGQQFYVDVEVHTDTQRAARSDDLQDAVDYSLIAKQVEQIVAGEPVQLIERLAETLAATVLTDERIAATRVTVHKPQAPVGVEVSDVTVSIYRDRQDYPALPLADLGYEISEAPEQVPAEAQPIAEQEQPASEQEQVLEEENDVAGEIDEDDGHGEDDEDADWKFQRPGRVVQAVIALGSNQGSSEQLLHETIESLAQISDITLLAVGPLARTAPVGYLDQDDFYNTVIKIATTLSPYELLQAGFAQEDAAGRVRTITDGPRPLDVDLIAYDDLVKTSSDLILPHPRAHQRAFVLVPWAHIGGDDELPGTGRTVADLAQHAGDKDGIKWLSLDWYHAKKDADSDA